MMRDKIKKFWEEHKIEATVLAGTVILAIGYEAGFKRSRHVNMVVQADLYDREDGAQGLVLTRRNGRMNYAIMEPVE